MSPEQHDPDVSLRSAVERLEGRLRANDLHGAMTALGELKAALALVRAPRICRRLIEWLETWVKTTARPCPCVDEVRELLDADADNRDHAVVRAPQVVTVCCEVSVDADKRFCPKCGYEFRVIP